MLLSIKVFFLNLILYLLSLVWTLVCVPLYTVFLVFYHIVFGYTKTKQILRRMISFYGYVIVKVFASPLVTISYTDTDPKSRKRTCVYVYNHRSFSDGFLLSMVPMEGVQVVKGWPFKIPILGVVAKIAGYLNSEDLNVDSFMEKATTLLKGGTNVHGFPEGTRSASTHLGKFHGLLFRLALTARVPIVPVCIVGNEKMPPRGSLILQPGLITMHVMQAIEWGDFKDLSAFQLKNMVRDRIDQEIKRIEKGV